jgi:rod shape-determining protein MreC
MPPFLERYRHLILLLAVLFAQLFFLAFQIKTPGKENTRLIRVWAMAGLSPVQKGLNWTFDGLGSLVQSYVLLYDVHQENLQLQTELETTKIRLQQLEARATEADRLAALLDLRRTHRNAPLVAAEVIGTAAANVPIIYINRGADKNLQPNMAVITPEGVVGKIITVHPATAEVLLLTHQKSGVGALVADSRVHGILKGDGTQTIEFAYVPNEEEIAVGSLLLTSGQDQVFPKGLPAGKIVAAERGSQESREYFWRITVEPAAQLSRLEQVLILAGSPESFAVAQTPPKPPETLPR